jgi:hypothetical protein
MEATETRPMPQRMSQREAIAILARHLPQPAERDRRARRRQRLDARRREIQERLAAGEREEDLAAALSADPEIGRITAGNLRVLLSRTGILGDDPDPAAPSVKAWRSGFGPVRRR